MYVLGIQLKRICQEVTYSPFVIYAKEFIEETTKDLGKFHRISGNKHFCTYVLVFNRCHVKAAGDPKLRFSRVTVPATSIFPHNTNTYVQPPQLTLSSSSSLCVVRQEGLEQFEQSMLSRIVSLENNEESFSHTIKKLKEDFEMVKRQFKSLTLKEEETRNRIMCEDLSDLLTPHGFTIGPKRLEGFTLPVTEFGTSRNDHCIIHQNYYATEDLKCVIVVLNWPELL